MVLARILNYQRRVRGFVRIFNYQRRVRGFGTDFNDQRRVRGLGNGCAIFGMEKYLNKP